MNKDTVVDISVPSHSDSISEMSCAVTRFVYEECVCVCVCTRVHVGGTSAVFVHACKLAF